MNWSVSTTGDTKGRITSSCITIGENYVLSYGGRETNGYSEEVNCDNQGNAAVLYDLNTLTLTDQFMPNQGTYKVSQKVYQMIGGK